jgi:[CysO sulfur-carrier protein]-S-L-cysteine hydrolase
MLIDAALLQELIAHAREEYDAECCGLIAYPDGAEGGDGHRAQAVLVRRAANVFASRKRFEIDGKELLAAINEFDAQGLKIGAIYHSHTHTAPYPSQTDINFAASWPGLEWVIVGLAAEEPEVRSYLIEDGQVREVAVEVR